MTRIFLIRHGQTLWNKELRYQGQSDVKLSNEGIEQAKNVAKRLKQEKFAAIYASDLQRAVCTADEIASLHGLEVQQMAGLREINFGAWEGMTYTEINKGWPEDMNGIFTRPDTVQIPGGETFSVLKERAMNTVLNLIANHPEENIAVVSHGVTIRTVLCSVLEIPLRNVWGIRQDNTAVNIIDCYDENKLIVSLVNDAHHLSVI